MILVEESMADIPAVAHDSTYLKRKQLKEKLIPFAFIIVPLVIYIWWVLWPMLYSFYLSLTAWSGFEDPEFIGFRNFTRLFQDPVFYISLRNNLLWVVSFITIPVALGLGLAMLLNGSIFGEKFFKASFFAPMVLSLVVCGLVWGWLYNPKYGLINEVLEIFGIGTTKRIAWLSEPSLVMGSIITVAIWRQVGYVMILYLAGLQGVDHFLIDASKVDGCSWWQTFRHVIIPQLAPVTIIVMVISVIDSLRAFDLVSVMTRGGPFNSSSVLANYMYIKSFNDFRMGYGAAISVILFMISLVFIVIYLQRIAKDEELLDG
jgi:ABC-type sugar transport system permease subunit